MAAMVNQNNILLRDLLTFQECPSSV